MEKKEVLICYTVYNIRTPREKDIELCGSFESEERLRRTYRMIENDRGWYIRKILWIKEQ